MLAKSRLASNSKALRNALIAASLFGLVLTLWFLGRDHVGTLTRPFSQLTHGGSASDASSKPIVGDKVAVIVETRMKDNLIPIVLHFASVLGPSWNVVLYTLEKTWRMPPSATFRRAVEEGRIQVHYIPPDTSFASWTMVSVFLTRPWLWEQLQDAKRMLLFQMDSILCSNSNGTVDDFLEYDFVGAPVAKMLGQGYNGGLSIRNPKLMLDLLRTNNFDEDAKSGDAALSIEDQWFYIKMKERGAEVKLPPEEVAKKFSVETVWYDTPVGFHKPRFWQKDRMDDIRKYCPEVDMID